MQALDFEVVAEGLAFPEGPVALPDGSLLVVEIAAGRLTRIWGDGRKETVAAIGGGPNGAALGPDGAVYICNNGGMTPQMGSAQGAGSEGRIERVDLATGKVERLYDRVAEGPLSGPNDLVFDAAGGIWFTDLGKTLAGRTEFGGLYYCRPDGGSIARHQWGPFSYNGTGLSPDGQTLYVADTRSARLWAFAVEAPGRLAPAPPETRSRRSLVGTSPGNVSLDSLAVTASGNICVGTIGHAGAPGGISVFSPRGEVLRSSLPDPMVTNICFGGPDRQDAYITLSQSGRLVRVRWPEPGLQLNFGP